MSKIPRPDSEDDLFSDDQPPLPCTSPSSSASVDVNLDSVHITLSKTDENCLVLSSRLLDSEKSSSVRISLFHHSSSFFLRFLVKRIPPSSHPSHFLHVTEEFLNEFGNGGEPVGALVTPSGNLFFFLVSSTDFVKDLKLISSLGESPLGLEVAVGTDALLLLLVGRQGRLAAIWGRNGEMECKMANICEAVEKLVHCQMVRNVLFCASSYRLWKVKFKDVYTGDVFDPTISSFRIRGEFRLSSSSAYLQLPESDSNVPFESVCLSPESYECRPQENKEIGDSNLALTLSRLESTAEEESRLRKEEETLDNLLGQLNVAAHLRLLSDDRRRSLLPAEARIEARGDDYFLAVTVTNGLDVILASGRWSLLLFLSPPSSSPILHQTLLTAVRKGLIQNLLFPLPSHPAPLEVSLHVAFLQFKSHPLLLPSPLLHVSLSPLHLLLPPAPTPIPLTLQPSVSVEIRPGDKMQGLPASLQWLTNERGVKEGRRMRFCGCEVEFERDSRSIKLSCENLQMLMKLGRAFGAFVVRRKDIGAEEMKRDLLLLQMLKRYGRNVEFRDEDKLFQMETLVNSLHCV